MTLGSPVLKLIDVSTRLGTDRSTVPTLELTHLLFILVDSACVAGALADQGAPHIILCAGLEPRWSVVPVCDGDHDCSGGSE